jgi:fructose/tagatose bisphosphate aldolase
MPLVNLKPLLAEAKSQGYAVAAFNPVDYASMKAMVKAAEELNAPVIIQTSAKTINYYGHDALVGWIST